MKIAFIAFFLLLASLHALAQEHKVTLQLTQINFLARGLVVGGGSGAMDLYNIGVQLKDNQTASGLIFVEDLTQQVIDGKFGDSETIKLAQESGVIGVMLKFSIPAQLDAEAKGENTPVELSGILAGKMDELKDFIAKSLAKGCQLDVDVNLDNGRVLGFKPCKK